METQLDQFANAYVENRKRDKTDSSPVTANINAYEAENAFISDYYPKRIMNLKEARWKQYWS